MSPNFISYITLNQQAQKKKENRRTLTEIVSFSFTIGTTPILKSSLIVFTAFKYRVRCQKCVSVAKRNPSLHTGCTHVRNIAPRKQNLCRPLIELTKQVIPERDEPTLTDGRECLYGTHVRKTEKMGKKKVCVMRLTCFLERLLGR